MCSVLEQSWKKVYSRTTTKSIPLLRPEYGFCQQNGPELAKYTIGVRIKKWWWSPFVNVVLKICFSKICYQCNFSEIFKERRIIAEPHRNSKCLIWCLLWWHKTLPGAMWTKTYSEPLQLSKTDCFCVSR